MSRSAERRRPSRRPTSARSRTSSSRSSATGSKRCQTAAVLRCSTERSTTWRATPTWSISPSPDSLDRGWSSSRSREIPTGTPSTPSRSRGTTRYRSRCASRRTASFESAKEVWSPSRKPAGRSMKSTSRSSTAPRRSCWWTTMEAARTSSSLPPLWMPAATCTTWSTSLPGRPGPPVRSSRSTTRSSGRPGSAPRR